MNIQSDIIIYFIKTYIMTFYVYYGFIKILNLKNNKNIYLLIFTNLVLSSLSTCIEFSISSYLPLIVLCICYGMVLGVITKNKVGYCLTITMISYAICMICFGIGAICEYVPYIILRIENNYLNLLLMLVIQFVLIYRFFKIKRFKNGFDFLYKSLNNDFADFIIINISIDVLIIFCLLGTIREEIDEIRKNLLLSFIILGITTFIMIQKTLKIYYKQKLLEDTLKEYKNEVEEKNEEINKLKEEKFSISKITHEFYNRQKALELLVTENIKTENDITKDNTNKKILETIQNITNEYTQNLEKVKNPSKLETTDIPEIDAMFKYMQNECSKNKIEFKLKIIGKIYPLINNIIPKNKLETLIGDHIRDAMNAVNSSKTENKEILTIIGIKENNYELSILDTGVEFEIDTLLKLGKEPVTTYQGRGGTGIGFLTTFETMKDTGASLVITEFMPTKQRFYTKSVTIKFDGKNEYKICSYRAEEIEKRATNANRIIIEKIQDDK